VATEPALRCVELFAGGGGAAIGLHAAGLRCRARVEWDAAACATLRAAAERGFIDDAPVIEGDVRAVDYAPFAGVDLLWASPPCQDWSSAGKRLGARGERNGWPWTWAAIDAVKPRWFIAENVAGMLHHRGGCEGNGDPADCPGCWFHRVNLPEIARRFPWCGWTVIDSADHGVPQHRSRVYIVAGPRPVRWPPPTHADPATLAQGSLFGRALLPWRTVRETLRLGHGETCWGAGARGHGMAEWRPRDVSGTVSGTVSGMNSSTGAHYIVSSRTRGADDHHAARPPLRAPVDGPAMTIDDVVLRIERGRGMCERHGERAEHTVDAPSPQLGAGSKGSGPRMQIVYRRGRAGGASSEAHGLDEPACALRGAPGGSSQPFVAVWQGGVGGCGTARDVAAPAPAPAIVGKGTGTIGSPGNVRRLTVDECRALMAWPEGYPVAGNKTEQYRIVGNGCTPPVVEALARAVVEADAYSPAPPVPIVPA
jgi:site-specific DNA-cytosine methylase